MSEALARIYAIQQRELNEKERHRQQQIAKRQRIITAFNATGFLAMFNEFRDLPVRADVRQRIYKQKVKELTYAETPANQTYSMSFVAINGNSNGPRWWCEEDLDSGNMRYCYSSGLTADHSTTFHTPQGEWLNRFVEYLAGAADPVAVAEKLAEEQTAQTIQTRRQLQPI